MNPRGKEARALRRQIRYVLKVSGGRLQLTESRPELLRAIGRFIDRMKFESSEVGARALGIKPTQFGYLVSSYRKLVGPRKKAAPPAGKKVKLAPVRIVDEPAKASSSGQRPIELRLESGVRVTVESFDQAIELLDRLEHRRRLKAAS